MGEVCTIFCCPCGKDVQAQLITGHDAYPHRPDLASLPFWRHDACGNHVGCHHKTKDRTRPLGTIPGQQMKAARMRIHRLLDPLWQSGRFSRREIYSHLSIMLGRDYHTADLRTLEEARAIYAAVGKLAASQTQHEPKGREG